MGKVNACRSYRACGLFQKTASKTHIRGHTCRRKRVSAKYIGGDNSSRNGGVNEPRQAPWINQRALYRGFYCVPAPVVGFAARMNACKLLPQIPEYSLARLWVRVIRERTWRIERRPHLRQTSLRALVVYLETGHP